VGRKFVFVYEEFIIKKSTGTRITQTTSAASSGELQVVDPTIWQTIIDQAVDGIVIVDEQQQIIFANPAAIAIYQQTPQEIIGQSCGFTASLNTCVVFNPVPTQNMSAMVEARTNEFVWGDRKVLLATLRPIINQKNENENDLEFYCRLNPDGTVLEVDESFSVYLSRAGFNPATRKIYELFSAQDWIRFEIQMQELRRNNSRGVVQTMLLGPDDKPLHVQWVLKAKIDPDGRVVEVEATGREQSRLNQLIENLDLSSSIIQNATEGILLTDKKGRVISINKAFTSIFGYRLTEVIGKPISFFQSTHHTHDFYDSLKLQVNNYGLWQGEVNNIRKSGEVFPSWISIQPSKDSSGQITNYIFYIRDISEIKYIETNLRQIAFQDALTNLPNRSQFHSRLSHALETAKRNNQQVVVLYLDLDRFKVINDTYGHEKGDLLLKMVSERLVSISRKNDTIARMGGDEFTVLLEGTSVDSIIGASTFAKKILSLFTYPFRIDNHEFYITSSIGISLYPNDGDDVTTLMKNADMAMYQAKELGKNNFQFFSSELNEQAHKQLDMEGFLRHAVDRNEFVLNYQPIVNASTGELNSIEALLRWDNPELGRVFPDVFIPLAESTGLIIPIGEWVLRTACLQIRTLRDAGWNDLQVSVNISGRQLEQNSLVETVKSALYSAGIPPSSLILEITESLLMKNIKATRIILQELRALGVGLSIDDFGTGYSSLNSLMVLPIDTLKIDKSFILEVTSNPQNMSLVQGIILIGHNLNLQVVAEGVETLEQASLLHTNGCDKLQGYHFSRPITMGQLTENLNKNKGIFGQI
jgi:diguanylate cyclase (GGDEF)-like protein/PAS domain S-box-containing protein